MAELQHAASQAIPLCGSCTHTTPVMPQGSIKLFRFDQPAQLDMALKIKVTSLGGGDPDVFVSDELPRSLFDFTRIGATEGLAEEVLLTQKSDSGVYWVAVRSSAGDIATVLPSTTPLTPLGRRRLSGSITGQYEVRADTVQVQIESATSITDQKFAGELSNWLTTTDKGLGTLVACSVIMVCLCGGCVFRMCCSADLTDTAQEKLEKQVRRHNQRDEAAAAHVANHVSNPVRSSPDTAAQRAGVAHLVGDSVNSPVHEPVSAMPSQRASSSSRQAAGPTSGRQTSQYLQSGRVSTQRLEETGEI